VRRIVARYGACLSGLPTRQRRVLRMRAGVGPREPASRAAVARRLDISVARVRLAERRGLRSLRRAAQEGCGASVPGGAPVPGDGATADPIAGGATTVLASGTGGAQGIAGDGGGGAQGDGAGGGGGASGSGGPNGADGRGSSGVRGITATNPPAAGAADDLTVPLIVVTLVALGGLAAWGLRRRPAA
jgi:hypothetical protein